MEIILDREARERLRREIDRAKRRRIGADASDDTWVTLPEASMLVGIRADELRPLVHRLGIETRRNASRTYIQVASLDRLR